MEIITSEDEIRTGEFRSRVLIEIHGLISAARVDPWIHWMWQATGDIKLLRILLEWEIQDRPEIRRTLERVIEIHGELVTASRIIKKIPKV